MNVSIQWLCEHAGIVRIHPHGHHFGGDYHWHCTIERVGPTAVLHGALIGPGHKGRQHIAAALRAEGFTKVQWERKPKGKLVVFDI